MKYVVEYVIDVVLMSLFLTEHISHFFLVFLSLRTL